MNIRRIFKASLLILALGLVAGCSSQDQAKAAPAANTATAASATVATAPSSATTGTTATANNPYTIPLVLESQGKAITAHIEANQLTQQLLDRAPVSFSLQSYGGHNFLYGDKAIEVKGDFKMGMTKGTLAYCRYGYLIIFQGDQESKNTSDFIKVGQIDPASFAELEALKVGDQLTIKRP